MAETLDTLVRLATIGASGVCIFAVFWIGIILRKPRPDATPEWHKSMRHYMVTCVLCGVIAGGTGVANAMFKAEDIKVRNEWNRELSEELKAKARELHALKQNVSKVARTNEFRTIDIDRLPNDVATTYRYLYDLQVPDSALDQMERELLDRVSEP